MTARRAVIRLWCIGSVLACLLSSGGAAPTDSSLPTTIAAIKQVLKDALASTKVVREALGRLDKQLSVALPSSMVKQDELEALERSTTAFRRLRLEAPPDLFTREQIRSIAVGGDERGTLRGAQIEKRRLRAARDGRAKDIAALKDQRAQIQNVRKDFDEQLDRTQKIADKVGTVMTPEVEVVARLAGKSVVLSWGDLVTTVIPAMMERNDASDSALQRLDAIIAHAEKDLAAYSDGIAMVEALFPESGLAAPQGPVDPRSVPGATGAQIKDLEFRMKTASEEASRLSAELQRQAGDIRAANAKIDQLTSLLSIVGSASTFASSEPSASPKNAQSSSTKVSVVVVRQENKWIVTAPAGPKQETVPIRPPR